MRTLTILALIIFMASCTKEEQKTANILEGKWKVDSYTVNGETIVLQDSWFKFNECDTKKKHYKLGSPMVTKEDLTCDGSYYLKFVDSKEEIFSFTFNINEAGDGLQLSGGNINHEMTIYDLEEDSFTAAYTITGSYTVNGKYYYFPNNATIKFVFSKIED